MTVADHLARRAIAELADQFRASRLACQLDAVDALWRELTDVRRRCAALEAENTSLKQAVLAPLPEPDLSPKSSAGDAVWDTLRHLATQLDHHASFSNALKGRLEWVVALGKGLDTWTRDVLNPFNRRLDNRVRFLEMLVEETILSSSPELAAKLARIRDLVGSADLSADELAPPRVVVDNLGKDSSPERR